MTFDTIEEARRSQIGYGSWVNRIESYKYELEAEK